MNPDTITILADAAVTWPEAFIPFSLLAGLALLAWAMGFNQ